MSFFSWLRNRKWSSTQGYRRTLGAARKPATFRPRLETLEDRCVPSTLKVTNVIRDYGSYDRPVPGTLRYEIA